MISNASSSISTEMSPRDVVALVLSVLIDEGVFRTDSVGVVDGGFRSSSVSR